MEEITTTAAEVIAEASAFTPELAQKLDEFIMFVSGVLLIGLIIVVFKALHWLFKIFF